MSKPAPNKSSKISSRWYKRAFDEDYVSRYAHRSDETALEDIPFIEKALGLPEQATILDLCCGQGRYSRGLADCGLTVVGLDLSLPLLQKAEDQKTDDSKIQYIRGDMRCLPFEADSFQGGVNLFTSFGYFSKEDDNAKVIRELARVLQQNAPFLLDFFNLETTLAGLVPESRRIVEDFEIREKRWYDKSAKRLRKEIRYLYTGPEQQIPTQPAKMDESVRAYSPDELTALFEQNGFQVSAMYGDLRGAPFQPTASDRCVLLGRHK